jgi:hypothetical protein
MNGIAAIFIGGIVAYIVKGLLGEGAIKSIISIIIGFIVMGFVSTL